jgi:ribosome-associated protein
MASPCVAGARLLSIGDVKSALSSLFCNAPYRYCLITPVMEPLRVNSRLVLPPSELTVSFARSGGPGGQKVNKTASQVQLRFSVTESSSLGERRRSTLLRALKSQLTASGELLIRAQRHREQARNLEDARERLAEALRGALKPRKARKATKPTRSSRERRMEAKRQRGRRKQERGGRYDP